MKICESCGAEFAAKQLIDGKMRSLYRRRFCLDCSPFGEHNTSKYAPGNVPEERVARRRERRLAGFLRYQRKRRRERKRRLIDLLGGRCMDCGYDRSDSALQFHHRDGQEKTFAIGGFTGSWRRLVSEATKCDLICANCHRIRHAPGPEVAEDADYHVLYRRGVKAADVEARGGRCERCGFKKQQAALEFHHLDPAIKEFGLSENGIVRSVERRAAEIEKCVLLCANCHCEVHEASRHPSERDGHSQSPLGAFPAVPPPAIAP